MQLGSSGSNDPDGSIIGYAWDFGNGQTASGTATQANYTVAGTYTVTLTVTDNRGAKGTATETIVVDPPGRGPGPGPPPVQRRRSDLRFDGNTNGTNLRVSVTPSGSPA